jgi:hypothetical protein
MEVRLCLQFISRNLRRIGRGAHIDGPTGQKGFGTRNPLRPIGRTKNDDTHLLANSGSVAVNECSRSGDRKIALAGRNFVKRRPPGRRPRRKTNLGKNFVWLQGRCQRSQKKLIGRQRTRSSAPLNNKFGLTKNADGWKLRSWVGVRTASSDRSAVSNLIVGNVPDRLAQ